MGVVKRFERSGKRSLMRALGTFLRAPRMTPEDVRALDARRIVVVRQQNQMGDMLLAVPALRAIAAAWPGAELDVVSSTLNRGVMRLCPDVANVLTYDKHNLISHLALLRALRRRRYDLAIVLHTVSFSFTSLMLGVLAGARVRVGSTSHRVGDSLTGSYLNLTLPLPTDEELVTMNEAEHNVYPLRAIGIDTTDFTPRIEPDRANAEWAESFAATAWPPGRPRVVIHPGAGKAETIWGGKRFAAVADRMASRAAVSFAAVEGPADRREVRALVDGCGVSIAVARGRSIGDVAALLRAADLVLCNDTGVMHVSAAAGARTLAVFGPTDPVRWAPVNAGLAVVRSPDGRLDRVEPHAVADRALDILESVGGAQRDA